MNRITPDRIFSVSVAFGAFSNQMMNPINLIANESRHITPMNIRVMSCAQGSMGQILLWVGLIEMLAGWPAMMERVNNPDAIPGDFKFDPLGLGTLRIFVLPIVCFQKYICMYCNLYMYMYCDFFDPLSLGTLTLQHSAIFDPPEYFSNICGT